MRVKYVFLHFYLGPADAQMMGKTQIAMFHHRGFKRKAWRNALAVLAFAARENFYQVPAGCSQIPPSSPPGG